jgi:hypothetical protein
MANFGSTAFYSRCVGAVSGLNAKSYSAKTEVEYKKTVNECGQNVQGFTKNVVSTHSAEGEITGGSAGGVCLQVVGASCGTVGTGWTSNMSSPGSVFVCTSAEYTETAGEWAKFSIGADNSDGI